MVNFRRKRVCEKRTFAFSKMPPKHGISDAEVGRI
jgi:hypothetical protein